MSELGALQQHTIERPLDLPDRAASLCQSLRTALIHATNQRQLLHAPREIHNLVKLIGPPPNVLRDLRAQKLHDGAYCIVGGEKNQARVRDIAHIKRDDSAWFDFSITVRE